MVSYWKQNRPISTTPNGKTGNTESSLIKHWFQSILSSWQNIYSIRVLMITYQRQDKTYSVFKWEWRVHFFTSWPVTMADTTARLISSSGVTVTWTRWVCRPSIRWTPGDAGLAFTRCSADLSFTQKGSDWPVIPRSTFSRLTCDGHPVNLISSDRWYFWLRGDWVQCRKI